jgi:hypothetical protein
MPGCRRKNDIKMKLNEIMCESVNLVHLTQRALVSTVMKLRIL